MGVQSIAAAVGIGSSANLLRLPVDTVGNRSITNAGAGPNAVGAHLRNTTIVARENFVAEAATKAGVLTGVGQLLNAGVGAPPNAGLNILRISSANSRAAEVQTFLRGPR